MSFKHYESWDNVPLDIREKVMKVVFTNKINFDENQVRFVRVDFWDYSGESDNGRMMDEGKTCMCTYRVPDIDNFRIYVTPVPNRNSLSMDFCNREADANMTQFIYVSGGVRY